jgi:hemoglobin
MDFSITEFDVGQRPTVTIPSPDFLNLLTEEGVRKMVSDHYDLLTQSKIHHLFPTTEASLDKAKQNSSDFFIQILGGPSYYLQSRGKPMLIKRHAIISITSMARIVWLQCYIEVLSKLDLPDNVIESFWNYLNVFSCWMVNSKKDNEISSAME